MRPPRPHRRAASPRPAGLRRGRHGQRGVELIEFALVALIFFTLLLGVMEFARWLFTLNAASEATRWGARLAVVCSMDEANIKLRMRQILPEVSDAQISIQYAPPGCGPQSCTSATVSLVNASFIPVMPFLGTSVTLPSFATTLPRELMNSSGNPVCASNGATS